jgi:hypothetical protein
MPQEVDVATIIIAIGWAALIVALVVRLARLAETAQEGISYRNPDYVPVRANTRQDAA